MTQDDLPTFSPLVLQCGTHAVVRPIRSGDAAWLAKGLMRLSSENRVRRFLYDKTAYSEAELCRFTKVDEAHHVALVLAVLDQQGRESDVVAVARCFRAPEDPTLAEVAVATVDEWQGQGIGTVLIRSLAEYAWAVGIRRWQAVCFSENRAIRKLLNLVGTEESERQIGDGVCEAFYQLHPPPNT